MPHLLGKVRSIYPRPMLAADLMPLRCTCVPFSDHRPVRAVFVLVPYSQHILGLQLPVVPRSIVLSELKFVTPFEYEQQMQLQIRASGPFMEADVRVFALSLRFFFLLFFFFFFTRKAI